MKYRLSLLALSATCVGFLILAWFLFVREQQPQKPEPPKPKTTQELLIGTWRMVNHNGTVLPDDYIITQEFTPDGKCIFRQSYPNIPDVPNEETTGTYTVSGTSLIFSRSALADKSAITVQVQIETISDEEFQGVFVWDNQKEINVFRKQLK